MEEAKRTWISSTAAAESTGLAAARAVLEWHDRVDVPQRLEQIGRALQQAMSDALHGAEGTGVHVEGPPHMFRLVAQHEQQLDAFVAAAARHGVLFKRGAYQFAALAHDDETLEFVHSAARAACRDIAQGRAT
jgi:glutamate-1-semialdehyde 2,1-aminomutase